MTEHAFTLQQVLQWAAEITGKGLKTDHVSLIDIIRESLEALYREESVENLRKWCIYSCGCSITIPREIGDPQKYKIGDKVNPVRNKAYEFLGHVRRSDCVDYESDMKYVGESPTYFDLPSQGGRLAIQSLEAFQCEKDEAKRPYIIVQGKDIYGKEIFSPASGKMDIGEKIYIAQPDEAPEYSKTIFGSGKISSVRIVNAQMNLRMVWCNTKEFGDKPYEYGLLANYDPGDDLPGFRRYEIPGIPDNCCYNIEILGMLRMPFLRYPNELIRGFDSVTIRSMIRANYYRDKNDIQGSTFNSNLAVASIRKNNENLAKDTDMFSAYVPTCAQKFPQL